MYDLIWGYVTCDPAGSNDACIEAEDVTNKRISCSTMVLEREREREEHYPLLAKKAKLEVEEEEEVWTRVENPCNGVEHWWSAHDHS